MAYQQAQIAVEKTREFGQLQAAIGRIFASAALEKFLRVLEGKGVRVREFEKIVSAGLLEASDAELAQSGKKARQLYASLTVSDQALMREFYLERIEQVEPALRERYSKVYRYY
ncbi:MAG TPA: hypothetical protein VKT33_08665 [Candidatus Angelobacter sp.]|nr:hypothetical protein [Candidatus Angelobacter sp.]